MSDSGGTAREVVAALEELRSEAEREKIRKRLSPGEEVIGVRMRHLFDLSKANAHLPLDEGRLDRVLERFLIFEASSGPAGLRRAEAPAGVVAADADQARLLVDVFPAEGDQLPWRKPVIAAVR